MQFKVVKYDGLILASQYRIEFEIIEAGDGYDIIPAESPVTKCHFFKFAVYQVTFLRYI